MCHYPHIHCLSQGCLALQVVWSHLEPSIILLSVLSVSFYVKTRTFLANFTKLSDLLKQYHLALLIGRFLTTSQTPSQPIFRPIVSVKFHFLLKQMYGKIPLLEIESITEISVYPSTLGLIMITLHCKYTCVVEWRAWCNRKNRA